MSLIEHEDVRLEKMEQIRQMGYDPFGGKFDDPTPNGELVDKFEEMEGETVRAAGRIMLIRAMGKASFMVIKDRTGEIQVFFQLNRLGEEKFELQNLFEAGDIIGVEGELKLTRTGEKTVFVDDYTVLCKALLSPPEKYHGLRDQETRHRRRYVDLFTNDPVMANFQARIEILRHMRRFLEQKGFFEVETPMMQAIPGGAAARPFITHHNTLDVDLYLRIAPELYLKRLLVGGMERVFEINRNFRNEGISPRHNPEFTMMELYQAYGDYNDMMDITEELISSLAQNVVGSLRLPWGEVPEEGDQGAPDEINFATPWPRRPFWELLEEHTGIGRGQDEAIREKARELDVVENVDEEHPEYLALQLFDKLVEDKLAGPVFVTDYPKSVCVLTKAKADDPEVAERFELFIQGMEMANAYTELNDPIEQEKRFLEQVGEEAEQERVDRDFLRALSYGMPPAGGLGIGIDRLVMVLTNNQSIREVILFPLLRPEQE